MTNFEQPDYDIGPGGFDPTFAENPEPRCPLMLLLDNSYSMSGARLQELNAGLKTLQNELQSDSLTAKRVEVAIVTYGPVRQRQDFVTVDQFTPPTLEAEANTPMGEAILMGIDLIQQRKATYKANGVAYYRPWMFLITDGQPTDDVTAASAAVKAGEDAKSFSFFAVGIDDADMETLNRIAVRQALKLKGLAFRELFLWLSASMSRVSQSNPGDQVAIENPAAPEGWAVI